MTGRHEVLAVDVAPVRDFLGQPTEHLIDLARADPHAFERWVLHVRQARDVVKLADALMAQAEERIAAIVSGVEVLNTYEHGPRTERLQ